MNVIVIGDNHSWGRAKTITTAFENAGKPDQYVAYLCPDSTRVSDFDGSLTWDKGDMAPVVVDIRKTIPGRTYKVGSQTVRGCKRYLKGDKALGDRPNQLTGN